MDERRAAERRAREEVQAREREVAAFEAGQELASALPDAPSWLAGWPLFADDVPPPPLPAGTLPEVDLNSFRTYLTGAGRKVAALTEARAASHDRLQHVLSPGAAASVCMCGG